MFGFTIVHCGDLTQFDNSQKSKFVKFLCQYGDDADDIIERLSANRQITIKAINSHFDDFIKCYEKYQSDFFKTFSSYPQYADDIIGLVNTYGNNVIEAFRNGITPEAIISLEEIGLTPDDFYGKGKIRNLKIKSDVDAKALIESRNKIHSLFSDEELRKLKLEVLKEQDKLKDKYTGDARAFTPAVAGVAYRNADGSITYYFGANDYGGNTPKLPDSLQARIDNMDSDIVSAAHEINGAVGSHAEIYAVAEMYEKHPNANRDDFVIYVNYSRPYNSPTIGHSFYTCEHCKEILDGYNIISNVEGF